VLIEWSDAYPIAEALLPDSPGIYQVSLEDAAGLGGTALEDIPDSTVLYLGKAEDSLARRVGQHLSEETTSSSTLRRSLGAVLSAKLGLHVRPRREPPTKERDFQNYRFDSEGEKLLTQWIREHVRIKWMPVTSVESAKRAESEWTRNLAPALNIQNNPGGVYVSTMRALRKRCQDAAREYWHRR
jgi:hypothetical protein